MFKIERHDGEFSPQEAAAMSGVSQDLQRLWRKRGILPKSEGPRHTRFTIAGVCKLKVLGVLSQSGISVKSQGVIGWQMAAVTADRVRQMREAAGIEGLDDLTGDEFRQAVEALDGAILGEHHTLFRLPEPPDGAEVAHIYVGAEPVGEIIARARKDAPLSAALVIEAQSLAQEIVAAAPRPLVTYIITKAGQN